MPQVEYFDNFEGEYDGLTVKNLMQDIIQAIKYSKFETRSDFIEKVVIKYDKFFKDYFDQSYNPHLTVNDVTSNGNNVCKAIELMATLLIKAENEQNTYDKTYFDNMLR